MNDNWEPVSISSRTECVDDDVLRLAKAFASNVHWFGETADSFRVVELKRWWIDVLAVLSSSWELSDSENAWTAAQTVDLIGFELSDLMWLFDDLTIVPFSHCADCPYVKAVDGSGRDGSCNMVWCFPLQSLHTWFALHDRTECGPRQLKQRDFEMTICRLADLSKSRNFGHITMKWPPLHRSHTLCCRCWGCCCVTWWAVANALDLEAGNGFVVEEAASTLSNVRTLAVRYDSMSRRLG